MDWPNLIRQGGFLAVATISWRIAALLWQRYTRREDGLAHRQQARIHELERQLDAVRQQHATDIEKIHREHAEKIAELNEQRVRDERLIVRGSAAQAAHVELFRDALVALRDQNASLQASYEKALGVRVAQDQVIDATSEPIEASEPSGAPHAGRHRISERNPR